MLLFIAVLKEDFEQYFAFQYISCYSLSFPDRESTIMCLCFNTSHITLYLSEITLFSKSLARFNTSHVTLYPLPGSITAAIILVSIHLMLLFIGKSLERPVFHTVVSIHLMLLFIQKVAEGSGEKCKFQYISCYSLSGFVQYPIFNCNSFNTSHVTLYLVQPDFYLLVDVFQYISCYSLSRWIVIYALFLHVSIHLMLLFIRNAEGN